MSFRSILVIMLAGICGIAAVLVLLTTTGGFGSKSVAETTPVLVASVEIRRGETITPGMLKSVDWPKGLVPPGALTSVEQAIDRTALTGILKDEPILELKVANSATDHGLAPLIRDGMRAFTILTPSDASGVAGFILPGNRVDVVLAVSGNDDATGGGTATTLLQNIEVLAVGQQLEAPRENRVEIKEMRSITLSVSPDQAAKLSLAQTRGTLHLSLRSGVDDLTAQVNTITLKELRYLQLPGEETFTDGKDLEPIDTTPVAAPVTPVTPVVERKTYQIRVLRGSSSSSVGVTAGRELDRS